MLSTVRFKILGLRNIYIYIYIYIYKTGLETKQICCNATVLRLSKLSNVVGRLNSRLFCCKESDGKTNRKNKENYIKRMLLIPLRRTFFYLNYKEK